MQQLRKISVVVVLAALFVLPACNSDNGGGTGGGGNTEFDRQAMLANLADNIIVPGYEALNTNTQSLGTAIGAFTSSPNAQSLADARSALRNAWTAWQGVNLYQFGPAGDNSLRSSLNTYPTDDRTIDSNISSGSYNLSSLSNISAVGFPAIDYLLNGQGSDEETLSAYSSDDLAANRGQYLNDLIAEINSKVGAVNTAWSASGGNFAETFAQNDGVAVGSSLSDLINAMNLQFERFTRDAKVGIPTGVRSLGIPIPENVEAFYGGYSVSLATANLEAFQTLFNGTNNLGQDGLGLDDHLDAVGAENEGGLLSAQINSQMADAIAAVSALPSPLSATVADDNDAAFNAFVEMQELVVLLKAEMSSALGVTITFQDNDGD